MILILQTGIPFTPALASPVANTGTGSRPNRLGDATISNPDPARAVSHTALGTSGAPWGTPAIYTFWQCGPRLHARPGRTNIDVSLFKEFAITERVRLQFRTEFFNLTQPPAIRPAERQHRDLGGGKDLGNRGDTRDIQFSGHYGISFDRPFAARFDCTKSS
jgi:hypothetical protein